MPDTIAFLADTPVALAADQAVTSQHPVAKLGSYRDPRYGKFGITRQHFDAWQRNLHALDGGRVAIDYDHVARSGGSTEAAGWITGLKLAKGSELLAQDASRYQGVDAAAEYVLADIEWTDGGAEAVRSRRYLYVSPEYRERSRDDQGKDHGSWLAGVALTNRPFLRRGMPTISLSRETETPVFAEPEPAGDSRRQMPEITPEILKALSLAEDADETKVLSAITELAEKPSPEPTPEPETKTLAQQAADAGKVLIDPKDFDELKTLAQSGADAAEERRAEKFTQAIELARKEGRMDAKEETESDWRELYDVAPEKTLARIADLPRILSTKAQGAGGSGTDVAPDGVDEEHYALNQAVLAYQGEHECDYTTALDAVMLQRAAD